MAATKQIAAMTTEKPIISLFYNFKPINALNMTQTSLVETMDEVQFD
jgi:hypothetical protein